jgi:hypothetical protein
MPAQLTAAAGAAIASRQEIINISGQHDWLVKIVAPSILEVN